MKLNISLFLLCAILPAALLQAGKTTAQSPNIVFILADDLGYGDLGCYGQEVLKTPNLDRLASEGLRLTRHYSGSTVCAPSRAVLLTGMHQGNARLRTNWDDPLPDGIATIASILRSAGYKTGCFGKWGVGNRVPDDDPNKKGFDEFYGYVDMFHAHNFFPPFLVRNGEREALRNDLIPGSDKGKNRGNGVAENPVDYAPEFIVTEALSFIDHHQDERFFLYLALNTPHANNEGQEFDRGMEVPDYGPFANKDWPDPEKGFARMIHDLDRDVGRVVKKLYQHGLHSNTLVIFSSDNGPHQEGGHQMEYFNSNSLLRGHKRDLYEGGVNVPMIAWWPGKIGAGQTSDHLSGFQDYMPTFCELAGIQAPACDGISLVPLLTDKKFKQKIHDYLYWEFYEAKGRQAVVDKRWKAVRLNWIQEPDGPIELYDLKMDPSEEYDLADQFPEIVDKMRQRMDASHTPHSGITKFPDWARVPKKIEKRKIGTGK